VVQSEQVRAQPVAPSRPGAVAGVVATMVSVSTPPFLVGTVAIQIAGTMPFSAGQLGGAVAGYYVVSAAVSPLGGRLVARLGPTLALRLACLGATLGLVGVATAQDAVVVVAALTFLGLPNALVQPASNQILSETVPAHRQGVAFGLVQSAIPSATLLSGALLAVFGNAGDWRSAVWVVVVGTGLAQLLIRPVATRSERGSAVEAELPPPLGGPLLMLGLVLGAVLASVAATTLPSFVASTGAARGLEPTQVAAVQVTGSLVCIGLRVLASWRGSLVAGPRVMAGVAAMLVAGSVGFALVAVPSSALFAVGVVLAYAFGWGWNGLFNLGVSRARAGRVPAATGMTQGGVFLGGVLGPLAFAAVLDAQGIGAAWLTVAVAALGASLSIAYAAHRWAGAGQDKEQTW
jgi:predicted MFS family arabinose efflux permease